jgi:arabinan endo-1,5-alpha-L-arabinosidase
MDRTRVTAVVALLVVCLTAAVLLQSPQLVSGPATPDSSGQPGHDDGSLLTHYEQLGPDHRVSIEGQYLHDPSRLVSVDGFLMTAVTGKHPTDGYDCAMELWYLPPGGSELRPGQCLFTDYPQWIDEEVPGNGGTYWAPALAGPRRIYYTVPDEKFNAACLGMATATGSPPRMEWTDSGESIYCNPGAGETGEPVPLDPAFFEDDDGTEFLVFGGGEIFAAELDSDTGRLLGTDGGRLHHLATQPGLDAPNNPDELDWMEAPFLYSHGEYYYLFVNVGACCRGLDSTYEVRVGRSRSPTGPFVDRDGVDMRDGGGTVFLDRTGEQLGDPQYYSPGHTGIYETPIGDQYLSFHYYDAENDGLPQMGIVEIAFEDSWPVVVGLVNIEKLRERN